MPRNSRTGRRAAMKLVTTARTASASSAFLPRVTRRKNNRSGNADAAVNFGALLEFTQANGQAEIEYSAIDLSTLRATYEVWIKTTVKTQQMLFTTAYTQPFIFIENDQIGVQWVGANSDPNYVWLSGDTAVISDGEWHHIAVVFNNNAIRFYKDGLPTADTLSVSQPAGGNHPVFMGGTWAGIPSFSGQMWNIRIWSDALDTAAIQADMYFGIPPHYQPGLTPIVLISSFNVANNTVANLINGVTGSLTNCSVAWDVLPQPPTYAFELTGSGADYVDIGNMAQIDTTAATFECWMQMSTDAGVNANAQTILLVRGSDASGASPRIEYDNVDKLGVFWNTPGAYSQDTKPISDGAWHHIAVVFNNNQVTFYKDGLPTNETFTLSATQTSGYDLQVGAGLGSTQPFNGRVTDVRVWNVARSISDIQAFMYSTLTGSESGLVALNNLSYYGSSNTIKNMVNGAPGALAGNAAVVQVVGPQSQQPVPQGVWGYPISGIAPLGPQISPKGLIYAENVAASNNGPAGNFLRSLDLQDHTLNWTYSVHDNSNIPTPVIPASVGIGNTVAYVAAQAQDTTGSSVVELHAVSLATGDSVWDGPATLTATNVVTKPVEAFGFVVMGANNVSANDGTISAALFWLDAALGRTVQSAINLAGAATFMSDPIVRMATINNATVPVAYFALSYKADPNSAGLTIVAAINLSDGSIVWTRDPLHYVASNMTVDQDRLYMACADGAMVAISLADGSIAWTVTKTNLAINSEPVVVGTAVYFGSTDGNLYALDGATGNALWQLNTGSPITTDLITEDGSIYFATQGNGQELPPTFFSVDAASQGNDTLIYPVPDADTILFAQGQANGVVYFYSKQNVYAVNLDMILHEFNVDTKLTVEDYDTSSSTANPNPTGNDTSYRITIALNDPLKAPRVYQSVKIWASDTVYLSNILDSNGNPTQIGPATPLWVQTDGSGQVSLALSAYDDGSKGGTGTTASPLVNCPAIYAWSNFMMPGEAIVIYPDHEHMGNLSNVQGQSTTSIARSYAVQDTLYLNQATTYDGSPLIASNYQDSTSLTNIAATIRNTIGTRNSSSVSAGVGRTASTSKYVAYPGSMPNVNYTSDNTQPTTRSFVPGANPTFTMDISGASGQATSYQTTFDPTRPSNLPAPNVPPTAANRVVIAGVGEVQAVTSIKDFFSKVVKGAEKVAKMAWQFTQNAVNTVIHTAESIYSLTISSLEDAITAVVGFFKSIVADLKKVIEWLSALFNFKNILANHNLIKSYVTNSSQTGALDQMKNWVTNEKSKFGSGSSDLDGIFNQLVGNAQSSMNSTGQGLAGQTVQSQQGPNSNPNDVYNTGGQNNATQCKFMQHKMTENGQQLNAPPPPRPRHVYLPWVSRDSTAASAQPMAMKSGPDAGTITAAWETFVSSLLDTVANDFKDFPAQLKAQLDIMKDKLKDPKSILSNGLTDLLAVLQVLADDMINVGKAIAADFLTLMETLLAQITLWLTQTLEVPFISRLYKALTGNALTYLDVFALVVAVPATILLEVIAGTPTPTALIAAQAQPLHTLSVAIDEVGKIFLGIVNFLTSIGGALIDAYMFAWSADSPTGDPEVILFSGIDVAKDVIDWAIGMVTSLAWNTWQGQDWGFWAMQATPLIYNFVFLFKPIPTTPTQVVIDTIFGTACIIVSSCYAHFYPSNYDDAPKAKGIELAANLFDAFSYPVELAAFAGSEGGVAGAIGKLIFDVVAAVLTFVGYVENVVHPSSVLTSASPVLPHNTLA